jgi:hypothetical protein
MTNINYQNFSIALIQKIPEFKTVFDQHLKEQHGELLPHVLFGDYTRFVVKQYYDSKSDQRAENVLIKCMDFVESLLQTEDPELRELVGASFVENLYEPEEEYYKPIRERLGPKTIELLNVFERNRMTNRM